MQRNNVRVDPWGVLSVLLFLVGVLTAASFFSKIGWLLDIASSFHLQYFQVSLIAAVFYGLGQRRRQMGVALAIALVNCLLIAPLYFGGGKSDAPECRILMANVHTANTAYDKLLSLVRTENPDMVVLMEINNDWVGALGVLRSSYPHHIEYPKTDNFGIAFYSRLPVRSMEIKMIGEVQVPSIHAVVVHDGQPWNIIGTHPLPPKGKEYWGWRNEQLDKMASYVADLGGQTVLLGDLNMAPWSYYFRKFAVDSGLRNGGKGFGLNVSWPTSIGPLGIPIDHCLISRGIAVNNRRTGKGIGSDHYPIIVDVALTDTD